MFRRILIATLAATLLPAARTAAAQVLTPSTPAPLDSVQQRYHDALWEARDSLLAVRTGLEAFRRDLSLVGPETVLSRAAVLRRNCAAADREMERGVATFDPARAPARPPVMRARARELTVAIRAVRGALDEHCARGFAARGPGAWADSLRAWGGFRAGRIEAAIRAYETSVAEFTQAAGFQLLAKTTKAGG